MTSLCGHKYGLLIPKSNLFPASSYIKDALMCTKIVILGFKVLVKAIVCFVENEKCVGF